MMTTRLQTWILKFHLTGQVKRYPNLVLRVICCLMIILPWCITRKRCLTEVHIQQTASDNMLDASVVKILHPAQEPHHDVPVLQVWLLDKRCQVS